MDEVGSDSGEEPQGWVLWEELAECAVDNQELVPFASQASLYPLLLRGGHIRTIGLTFLCWTAVGHIWSKLKVGNRLD